jgi:hypothetical protein
LEGVEVTIDGAYSGLFPLGNLGYSQAIETGFDGPYDPPLASELITSHLRFPARITWKPGKLTQG